MAARQDQYAGEGEIERLGGLLEEGGAVVTTHWVPGGRGLTKSDIETAEQWLQLQFAGPAKEKQTK